MLAAVAPGENRLHVFRRSSTDGGNLFHQWWDGQQWRPGLTEWENIGGELYTDPVAVSFGGDDQFDVFAGGPHNNLIHKRWSGQWQQGTTGWETFGVKIFSAPAATAFTAGDPTVFYVGPNERLNSFRIDDFGSYFLDDLGGAVMGMPAAVSGWPPVGEDNPYRLDVFASGLDGHVQHKSIVDFKWTPTGADTEDFGGPVQYGPAAVCRTTRAIDVFAISADGHLLHKAWNGHAWSPSPATWENMGGNFQATPAVVARDATSVDVIVVGPDNRLFNKNFNGVQWSPFWPLHVTALDTPVVVSSGPNRVDVFYTGSDAAVHQLPWDTHGWLEWQSHGGAEL